MSTNTDRKRQTMQLLTILSHYVQIPKGGEDESLKKTIAFVIGAKCPAEKDATKDNRKREAKTIWNPTIQFVNRQTDKPVVHMSLQAGKADRLPSSPKHCKTPGRANLGDNNVFLGFIFYSGTFHYCIVILEIKHDFKNNLSHSQNHFPLRQIFLNTKVMFKIWFTSLCLDLKQSDLKKRKKKERKEKESYRVINVLLAWTS